ncbi:hypothetical protein LGK95_10080 [Clostridium algoriphilum]|uniref:homocitrate synthase/isopropylmalate synthase family protein n=1 Tax=Clostridium algoriphilum TaxID=198347 RepID=UPI001CF44CE6|nr:hypothetical protein [Clostridium algoriphilum]MCB2293868.1 hypothetical protein [Clostridium algoriphilum]
MSLVIKEKDKFIIDRTLMNITKKSFNEKGLPEFIRNLKGVGVDFFEIDEEVFNFIKLSIKTKDIIFRVNKASQLQICKARGIEYILIREENLEIIKICNLEMKYNFKIILEIDVKSCASDFMQKINENIDINKLFSIRIKGESNWVFNDYIKDKYNVNINIYASDEFSMATAVGFQGLTSGIQSITTAFGGRDGTYGTTALEELLVATKVIMGEKVNGELGLLSEMREQYEKITYKNVPDNKAIIGKNIFKYESGVHVAGIEKNPVTYEPFMPELVGMKRKLALGKHSGKNSINSKLKELNMDNKFSDLEILNILGKVKNISISNKTEVSDKDFIDICRRIKR